MAATTMAVPATPATATPMATGTATAMATAITARNMATRISRAIATETRTVTVATIATTTAAAGTTKTISGAGLLAGAEQKRGAAGAAALSVRGSQGIGAPYWHCTIVGVIRMPSETTLLPEVMLMLSPVPPLTVAPLLTKASHTEKNTSP